MDSPEGMCLLKSRQGWKKNPLTSFCALTVVASILMEDEGIEIFNKMKVTGLNLSFSFRVLTLYSLIALKDKTVIFI